ncbi:MAG: DUF1624 domain-containing protein [Spirochaetales bacterium]|nr:DUF1624 domain-containing protein [Spirochaetales bacterium]
MKRYWEIDTLRAAAILLMIIFHVSFMLDMFMFIDVDLSSGFWWWFPRGIAATFITIAGISESLSYNRNLSDKKKRFKKIGLHGVIIFGLGLIITAISYFTFGQRVVLFGILHLIGLSLLLGYPLARYKYINLVLSLLIVSGGILLGEYRFDFYWFCWLGLRPARYAPVDYLPLLPWAGYLFFGLFLGNLLYPEGRPRFILPQINNGRVMRFITFVGRHSLYVYLAHLPIIYGITYLFKLIFPY